MNKIEKTLSTASKIKLLDCTLRDGAYIVEGKFGVNAIKGITSRLTDAHVDIVECGWLKDPDYIKGSTYYHIPGDAERFISPSKRDGTIYSAMIDWDRYDLSKLHECDRKSIDAIRIVFPKGRCREAAELGKNVKSKGYILYFQAANTLGYSDQDLLELVNVINEAQPKGLSVVDTFGAMYEDDLRRIVSIVHHNLDKEISLGLHSHNNLQQSFSLSMAFIRMMSMYDREIIVDASLSGMGRGAGNAPTELVAGYLNRYCKKNYDMNIIMDVIDSYMTYFSQNYKWGYSTAFFLSGTYCSHVNNIAYLTKNHKTRNRDIKQILEALPQEKRYIYDYDLLEQAYVEHQQHEVDDSQIIGDISAEFGERPVLLVAPGHNAVSEKDKVDSIINQEKPIAIGVNAILGEYNYDYLFFSNAVRLQYALETQKERMQSAKLLLTSNLSQYIEDSEIKVQSNFINYNNVIKRGWMHFDNSVVLCLRFLEKCRVEKVYIAGFDGYSPTNSYADSLLQPDITDKGIRMINKDISEIFADFVSHTNIKQIELVTTSVFKNPARRER